MKTITLSDDHILIPIHAVITLYKNDNDVKNRIKESFDYQYGNCANRRNNGRASSITRKVIAHNKRYIYTADWWYEDETKGINLRSIKFTPEFIDKLSNQYRQYYMLLVDFRICLSDDPYAYYAESIREVIKIERKY